MEKVAWSSGFLGLKCALYNPKKMEETKTQKQLAQAQKKNSR